MIDALVNWFTVDHVWVAIGFLGQGFFFSRFLVQWWASERARRSVVPIAFWYFSIGGGVVLLAYSIYKMDPVFIMGQGLGLVVYFRNLYLIFVEHAAALQENPEPPEAQS
ncbi:MAG: lipid A biosynthesis [Alphaproteobacteria bacterium]|nr:lipid A biosynthesis [Alphaproteobacteria bacterium]